MTQHQASSGALRVGVLGVGHVGGYVSIALSASEVDVRMLYKSGRVEGDSARLAVTRHGRVLVRGRGALLTDDPRCLRDVDLCLVCVKSGDTQAAARLLLDHRPGGWVLSLQNGLGNVRALKEILGPRVLGGLVTFNVSRRPDGVRQQATRGAILVEKHAGAEPLLRRFAAALGRVGEAVALREDIEHAQAGKLVLNLNNGVCAATGLSVAELLRDADARYCVARCLREGDRVLRESGLEPARVGLLSGRGVARVMRLPGAIPWLGARLSGAVTKAARVSTLVDLERGRPTEIGELNGAIVTLARRLGRSAPANEAVTCTVRAHERAAMARQPVAFVSPRELRARIDEDRVT